MKTFDRYSLSREEGKVKIVPTVIIPKKSTDYFETYKAGFTRLDVLSYKYYKNPNYDWLIMAANPEYGSMEYAIPDNVELRIPYPLDTTLKDYTAAIKRHNELF